MLPIPQCVTLAIVIVTLVISKYDVKDKDPFDMNKQ